MARSKLYVALYQPRYGNYQHWALFLDTDTEKLIFEVTGSHPNFKRNVVKADPRNSRSFVKLIYLDSVALEETADVEKIAQTTEIDNETLEWDCQEYVFDMLEIMEKECLVDEDDKDYKKAKKELKKKRGPM